MMFNDRRKVLLHYKNGKQAQKILRWQQQDGSWGAFHTLKAGNPTPMTTEFALSKLQRLGYTIEDISIQRAVAHMESLLCEDALPEGNEKTNDFDTFRKLMLATRIREFKRENEKANQISADWASVIIKSFADGKYQPSAYDHAYLQVFGRPPKGGRLCDFVCYYQLSLLSGMLDLQTERSMLCYVLQHPAGIYYVYEAPLTNPPPFSSKAASRYLSALELLSQYETSREQLSFAVSWLSSNQNPDGTWDMGLQAKDGTVFPLSDRWDAPSRRFDCTYRIQTLLDRIQ